MLICVGLEMLNRKNLLKSAKIVLFLFFATFIFFNYGSAQEHIQILNWNDFHSSNVARLMNDENGEYYRGGAALLKGAIDSFCNDSIPSVTVHAGDEFQGSPICGITRGASQIRLLNLIKPDVFALGNHEFDFGSYHLDSLLQKAEFSIISANLINTDNNKLFVSPYKIHKAGEVKIGFIGLMTPELVNLVMSTNIQNIRVEDQLQVVEKYVKELKSLVDILVVVSHMGYEYDRKLAKATNQIDVILGGHSHTVLEEPQIVNGVIISQAGSYGRFLGKLDVWVNTDLDTIVKYNGELLAINSRNFSPNLEVHTVVDSLESIVNLDLREVIAELKTDWIRSDSESNIGNWISDVFRDYTNSDISFVNSGGIRKNLAKGLVKKRDFWEISPFGNFVIMFEASGEEINTIMEYSVGGRLGSLQVSGMKMVYNPQKEKNEKVDKIFIQGKPIDKNETYKIATLNYVYDKIVNVNKIISGDRKITDYDLDRNILINAAKNQKVISSKVEGRITKVNH